MIKLHGHKMFVSDYDGTLANNNGKVSAETFAELSRLGQQGIIRVIATGRSMFSFENAVGNDFPLDYLICSSGIGIYDWKNKLLLQKHEIPENETKAIYNYLINNGYDFMVQLPIPDNHFFHHFDSKTKINPDFQQRISNYEASGLKPVLNCPVSASQFVVICTPENDNYLKLSTEFKNVKIVKATSPLDGKSIWVEILPFGISKASGIEFLRYKLKINKENITSVGNDYYDLDMLNYTYPENTYIVNNSPDSLKERFNIINSNENDGVAELLRTLY